MSTQSEIDFNEENENGVQEEIEVEGQLQAEQEVDEEALAEEYWNEFTNVQKAEVVETTDGIEEEADSPDDAEEDDSKSEEHNESESLRQVSDEQKAAQVFDQAEQTKKGNKNYIDHDLINSIEDKELRQKVWSLANTAQSHYHRVYAKEQEVNKLRNQITQLEAEREVAKQSATTQKQEDKIDKDTEAKISRLKRDYPDLADSIEAMFQNQLESRTKELRELIDQSVVPMKERYEEESRQAEIQRLEEAANDIFHTDTTGITFREVVASPDFKTWLDGQDESIKRLANSDRAAEVISVLKNFEYDYSREYQKAYGKSWVEAVTGESQAKKPSSTNSSTNPELAKKAEAIKQKRENKKKAAVSGIAPSRQSTNNDAQADAEAYFNHFAKQSRYAR